MWICSTLGFFSLTKSTTVPGSMHFRARVRQDLENLKTAYSLEEEIIETPHADYRWRIVVSPGTAADVMQYLVFDIDYSNFKSAVHEEPTQSNKNGPYMEIWRTMQMVQSRDKFADEMEAKLKAPAPAPIGPADKCENCGRGLGVHRVHDNACPEGEGFHAICRFKLDPKPRPPVNPPEGWTVSKGAFKVSANTWTYKIKRGDVLMRTFIVTGGGQWDGRQKAIAQAHRIYAAGK